MYFINKKFLFTEKRSMITTKCENNIKRCYFQDLFRYLHIILYKTNTCILIMCVQMK